MTMVTQKVFEQEKISFDREGKKVSFDTGKLAVQTDGTTVLNFEENALMYTVCMDKNPNPNKDFLPLMLDFRESYSAAGRIAGAVYRRREWKASDDLILYARLTDRALRPLFPKWMINDIVISVTPLALDHKYPLGAMSIVGSSMAILTAGIPFDGPVGAAHIAYKDGEFILNPTFDELENATLDLIVAWKKWSINMIESWANEVTKDILKKAFEIWQVEINKICDKQSEFLEQLTIAKKEVMFNKPSEDTLVYISNILTNEKLEAMTGNGKIPFNELYREYEKEVLEICEEKIENEEEVDFTESKVKTWVFMTIKHFIRDRTVETGKRVDDRWVLDIRPLYCETGLFARPHGTWLFRRWETQVLTTVTLGGPKDYLILDDMENDQVKKRYFHHYNFPPFSVWEARNIRFVGRREIWHGRLAEKAIEPMLPSQEDFPYSIRTVSECLGSGGSTSMWATCASTLSLLHAGVPLKRPVSGIAMWMMSKQDKDGNILEYKVLTDIMGTEDFTGDMDFKVAGTKEWITAIQLDTKVKWITMEIIHEVIDRAFDGYNEILDFMLQTIDKPSAQMNKYAPKIISFMVPIDKVKDVIGKGGEIINKIIEECNDIKIDFEEDGTCFLTHSDQNAIDKAMEIIKDITEDLEVGKTYDWTVSRIEDYGIFVQLPKKKSGMCHVSKLWLPRWADLNKSFKIWDKLKFKLTGIDDRWRLNLEKIVG